MSVTLSPLWGAGAQLFDNYGNVLTGGKIYTYAAGTTTNQATYTSSTGTVAHTNPIILDSAGRVPGGEIWLANTTYKFILKDSNDVLIGTYDNISDIGVGQLVNVKDYGATGNGVTDDTAAILAACAAAKLAKVLRVYFPAGTYAHTTLNLTDYDVQLIGDGENFTILKYIGVNTSDGIKFGSSQLATTKVKDCGLIELTVNANSLARRAVEVTSVVAAIFRNIQILNPYAHGMYWTCLDDRLTNAGNAPADNQRCTLDAVYVECVSPNNAVAIFMDGNAGAAAATGANTSLNNFQNIRLNIRNGDGFVYGFADGNTLNSLFVFRATGSTGRGLVFSADDTGNNRHARHNMGFNIQTASAGVYALAGTGVTPSDQNYIVFNYGNAGVNNPPTIETGATLGWAGPNMLAKQAMWQGVMVGGATGTAAAANAGAQIQDVTTESLRVYNTSSNHIQILDNSSQRWALNIESANGDLRFTRAEGTGLFTVLTGARFSGNVGTSTATYTTGQTLNATNGVVLVNALSANVTIVLPLSTLFGTNRSPILQIRRIDSTANTVTIQRQGTDTLNGTTSETLAVGQGKTYVSSGSGEWYSF